MEQAKVVEPDYLLRFLKKINCTQNCFQEKYDKYSHQNLFAIICISPSSTKVFLQLEYHIELLFHLQIQYQVLLQTGGKSNNNFLLIQFFLKKI